MEAVAIGLRDHLAHLAADIEVVELGDGDRVVVPALVGDGLEVPFELAGIDVERDDRAGIEIVAGPSLRIEHVHGIAGAEIGEVRLRIEGRLGPHAAAAERNGARIGPGLRARLARLRHHREPPQELAGVGGIGGDVAAAAFVAPRRADQNLVLDRERRRGMPGAGAAVDRGRHIEHRLTGVLVERDQARIRAVAAGVDVEIVAEQRDAVEALPAALYLGIVFPHDLRLLVADVELPVLLILVADIEESVLDQRREILIALARPAGIADRRHELDLEVGDVALVDLVEGRVVPVVVAPHAHQPVLRLRARIEQALIGGLCRQRGVADADEQG